ncbi:hypothetical protein D3C72_1860150 [compost metagenome]
MGRFRQALEGFDRVGALAITGTARAQVRCGADFEELVEVRRHDAQVAQPFDQRHFGPVGPVEHALVEREDAVVAVQQRERRRFAGARRVSGEGGHGH